MIYGTLHLRLPNGQQQSHNISQSSVLIGRGLANDLLLNDSSVAPSHARLTFQRGEVVVEDLGTINGTFINGVQIEPRKPYVLNKAEFIRFGNVDAMLTPPNSAAPEWPPLTTPPPVEVVEPAQPEAPVDVQPPPTPKLVSLKLNPKRAARVFTLTVTRTADDPDLTTQTILLAGNDPTDDLAFSFKPQVLKLDPGQSKTSQIEVRGLPGPFTITAAGKGKSYTTATKGALIAPDRTVPLVIAIAAVLSCLTALLALSACPTSLRGICGFIPANPISMAVSTSTFTPSATFTPEPTQTPLPTETLAGPSPTSGGVVATATTGGVVPSQAPTSAQAPGSGGILTFKRQQANGFFTLLALPASGGDPVQLIANKTDFRVLDYAPSTQTFAVDVNEGVGHTLWLVKADGTVILQSANEGWTAIRNGDFGPDGSYLVLDTLDNNSRPEYRFYGADGSVLTELILQTPTETNTPSRTPTNTFTFTPTLTPSRTPTPTLTPRPSRTSTNTQPPSPTRTPSATRTPTDTRTPKNSQTAEALANPSATPQPPADTAVPADTQTPESTP